MQIAIGQGNWGLLSLRDTERHLGERHVRMTHTVEKVPSLKPRKVMQMTSS